VRKDGGLPVAREDKQLVEGAIAAINHLWKRGVLQTAVSVGDYLIDAFFDGNIGLALSHSPVKPNALRHLYQRVDELPVSLHQLRVAVRVAAQWRQLPEHVAEALSVSQHELLLLVDGVVDKERIAREAIQKRLTVRQLEQRVRGMQPKHAGGRPALPAVVKWIRAVARAAAQHEDGELLEGLSALPPDERQSVHEELRRLRQRLDALVANTEARGAKRPRR
jgi:hypothetical protein